MRREFRLQNEGYDPIAAAIYLLLVTGCFAFNIWLNIWYSIPFKPGEDALFVLFMSMGSIHAAATLVKAIGASRFRIELCEDGIAYRTIRKTNRIEWESIRALRIRGIEFGGPDRTLVDVITAERTLSLYGYVFNSYFEVESVELLSRMIFENAREASGTYPDVKTVGSPMVLTGPSQSIYNKLKEVEAQQREIQGRPPVDWQPSENLMYWHGKGRGRVGPVR